MGVIANYYHAMDVHPGVHGIQCFLLATVS
jgi:hypothetical protein